MMKRWVLSLWYHSLFASRCLNYRCFQNINPLLSKYKHFRFKIYALPFQKAQTTPQASDIDIEGIWDDALDVTTGSRHGLRGVMKANMMETTRHGRRHRSVWDGSRRVWEATTTVLVGRRGGRKQTDFVMQTGRIGNVRIEHIQLFLLLGVWFTKRKVILPGTASSENVWQDPLKLLVSLAEESRKQQKKKWLDHRDNRPLLLRVMKSKTTTFEITSWLTRNVKIVFF